MIHMNVTRLVTVQHMHDSNRDGQDRCGVFFHGPGDSESWPQRQPGGQPPC